MKVRGRRSQKSKVKNSDTRKEHSFRNATFLTFAFDF